MLPINTGLLGADRGVLGVPGTAYAARVTRADAKIFYVDPAHANANDDNDGNEPNYPLVTIQQAINNAVSGRGDTINVMPGSYAENLSITKDYLTIVGALPGGYARPDVEAASGVTLTVHAQGFVCIHMRFVAAGAADGVRQQGNGFAYVDCVFDGDTGNCFNLLPDVADDAWSASEGIIDGCLFRGGDKGLMFTNPGPPAGVGPTDNVVQNCRFYGQTTNAIDDTDTAGSNDTTFLDSLIVGCHFLEVGAAYVYIQLDAGGNNSGAIAGCYFADADVTNTQVVLPAGILFPGNFDGAGIAAL